ncbi:DUF3226 domain-containing protein [Moraxella sp. ZY210820]|uniref:DUF3226 domain-containing protein n=1 Tax=unclassified Moraxella TaxID=2685852 RepID=UPI00272FF436|nr:DUF3226 domain-containing protein [Moraxella sp. ZY210820]WLF82927.1 hypothetical protein LU301_06445 [Moraxella sp. ZY210820]
MSKFLLVEGKTDVNFFELFCKYHKINIDNIKNIDILSPTDIDFGFHNNKGGVIDEALDDLLLQIQHKRIERLGVIVDADFEKDGQGFAKTHQRIANKLAEYDYLLSPNSNIATYQLEKVQRPDIGVWIMPNNKDSGSIEHWIKENIHQDEQIFYEYVDDIIENISDKRFKPSQQLKVKIGTWLLWQKHPHLGTISLFAQNIDKLIDRNSGSYQALLTWFEQVFNSPLIQENES